MHKPEDDGKTEERQMKEGKQEDVLKGTKRQRKEEAGVDEKARRWERSAAGGGGGGPQPDGNGQPL